jgi:hypothetical protein
VFQRPRIGEIVLRAGIVSRAQLEMALAEHKKWGGRLGLALIKLGFLTEADLVRALASQLDLPVASLDGKRIPQSILALVPHDFADEHTCLPLFVKEEAGKDTLYLATDDPCNLDVLDDLAFRTGLAVKPVVVAASEICEGIDRFYRDRGTGDEQNYAPELSPVVEVEEQEVPHVDSRDTTPFDELSLRSEAGDPAHTPELSDELELSGEAESRAEAPKQDPAADEPPTRLILHVLTQIMIEKGVMTREEFQHRLQRMRGTE